MRSKCIATQAGGGKPPSSRWPPRFQPAHGRVPRPGSAGKGSRDAGGGRSNRSEGGSSCDGPVTPIHVQAFFSVNLFLLQSPRSRCRWRTVLFMSSRRAWRGAATSVSIGAARRRLGAHRAHGRGRGDGSVSVSSPDAGTRGRLGVGAPAVAPRSALLERAIVDDLVVTSAQRAAPPQPRGPGTTPSRPLCESIESRTPERGGRCAALRRARYPRRGREGASAVGGATAPRPAADNGARIAIPRRGTKKPFSGGSKNRETD